MKLIDTKHDDCQQQRTPKQRIRQLTQLNLQRRAVRESQKSAGPVPDPQRTAFDGLKVTVFLSRHGAIGFARLALHRLCDLADFRVHSGVNDDAVAAAFSNG
jgi:hypothetical protein